MEAPGNIYAVRYSPPNVKNLDPKKLKNVDGATEFLASFPQPLKAEDPRLLNSAGAPKKSKNVFLRWASCGCCGRAKKQPSGVRVYERNL